jgi:hypothetical protein
LLENISIKVIPNSEKHREIGGCDAVADRTDVTQPKTFREKSLMKAVSTTRNETKKEAAALWQTKPILQADTHFDKHFTTIL